MFKKFMVALCMVILVAGLVAGITLPVTAAESAYQVGYARVDVNPYIEDGNFDSGIMALPLRGTGDVWNRLSTAGLVDDNGDGVKDENDGLKATCVAVSDETGKTILLISIDLSNGAMISKVNTAIVKRLAEEQANGKLTDVDLTKEAIYYGGTHTHNAPDTTVYTSQGKTGTNNDGVDLGPVNENLGEWINRTAEDVADAAIIALNDRSAATAYKDQLSASDATSEAVKGKQMLSTRHYINGEDGSVAGDNFNDVGEDPTQITEADDTMYLLKFTFADKSKLPIVVTGWRGHPSLNNNNSYKESDKNCISSDYINAYRHALEFGVDVKVKSETDHVTRYVTSWELGTTQKYRVIFFNGTGGNVNTRGQELMRDDNGNVLTYGSSDTVAHGYSWIGLSAEKTKSSRGCSYGVVLAAMANECLTDSKNETKVSYGEIKTMQKTFTAYRKQTGITKLGYNAALAYQASDKLYDAANAEYKDVNTKFTEYKDIKEQYDSAGALSFLYKKKVEVALDGYNTANSKYIDGTLKAYEEYMAENFVNAASQVSATTVGSTQGPTKPLQEFPMIYKEENETFAIASRYHASNLKGSWDTEKNGPKTENTSITLYSAMMGPNLAFVVIPGEPFDYYFNEYGNYTPENNLWNILNNEVYGKPMVLGYANGMKGYIPNYEAYFYNTGRTDKAIGSYEVHNNTLEAGTGERMIREFSDMLGALNSEEHSAYCENCKQYKEWSPFVGQPLENNGHYYLSDNYEGIQNTVAAGVTCCFDLNGYTISASTKRVFYVNTGKATLNIMDSVGGGVVAGGAGSSTGGGVIYVDEDSTFNLYSGTIRHIRDSVMVKNGGCVRVNSGTFRMYSGTIEGKDVVGNGCAVNTTISSSVPAKVEILGGTVKGATANGDGNCIYIANGSTIKIANDANIEDIYFGGKPKSALIVDTNEAAFTGSVQITCATVPAVDTVLGICDGTEGIGAGTITIADSKLLTKEVDGKLMATMLEEKSFHLMDKDGMYESFDTFQEALDAYTYDAAKGNYIKLTKDVSRTTIHKTIAVDLNGFYLSNAIVEDGVDLYVMDSQTDDYTIDDEMAYGMVNNPILDNEATVQAMEGYLMLREGNGYSFHRVTMAITGMSLRAGAAGVYYTARFYGDEIVAENVKSFGIALSVMEAPDAENLQEFCRFTVQKNFSSGVETTGVLVQNILKPTNTAEKNKAYGEMDVYGRTYIEIGDGYVFGKTVVRDLRQQLEAIDDIFNSLTATQKAGVAKLYKDYAAAMVDWDIPNIKAA